MMNKFSLLVILFFCMAPVSSLAAPFYSVDGDKYSVEYNTHGAVLTSEHEKYFPENQESAEMKKAKLVLYLGVECDAYSENYGNGTWWQSPGGFVIRFERKAFGFIRQELAIANEEKCLLPVE